MAPGQDSTRHPEALRAGDESVLVTKHGKPAAVVYPLGDPEKIPIEVRRKLYLAMAAEIAKQLDPRRSVK